MGTLNGLSSFIAHIASIKTSTAEKGAITQLMQPHTSSSNTKQTQIKTVFLFAAERLGANYRATTV